jgi:DNA-binding transcriptional regulator LsrR (DeoR family)
MTRQHGKLIIAVAGGRYKFEAIRGALLGRLCNVLITDEEVAQALVHEPRPSALYTEGVPS